MFTTTVRPHFFSFFFGAVPPVVRRGITQHTGPSLCRVLKPPAAGRVAMSGAIGPRPGHRRQPKRGRGPREKALPGPSPRYAGYPSTCISVCESIKRSMPGSSAPGASQRSSEEGLLLRPGYFLDFVKIQYSELGSVNIIIESYNYT